MTKIKICGLKTLEDIAMVNRQRPDYIGFVFAGTKRKITPEAAAQMKQCLSPDILSVGVFVNEPLANVLRIAGAGVIDLIQLHGDEGEDYIRALKEKTEKPVIKGVRVRTSQDILAAQEMPCDFLLLDSYQKGEYGGSGRTFSWELIPELRKPCFLAGGLDVSNVGEAIERFRPWAVDVSSSVETNGKKDEEKVRKLIEAVRRHSLSEEG